MRTPSRTVKKILKEKFPEYKFSVRTTKPQSRMARKRDQSYLNVKVILPMKLDTRSSRAIQTTVSNFISKSNDIKGWAFSFGVGVTSEN